MNEAQWLQSVKGCKAITHHHVLHGCAPQWVWDVSPEMQHLGFFKITMQNKHRYLLLSSHLARPIFNILQGKSSHSTLHVYWNSHHGKKQLTAWIILHISWSLHRGLLWTCTKGPSLFSWFFWSHQSTATKEKENPKCFFFALTIIWNPFTVRQSRTEKNQETLTFESMEPMNVKQCFLWQ